jgi:hypothetical protein
LPGQVQLESNVLAGLELGQRPAIVRREIKRMHVLAFADFLQDLKFPDAVPEEFALFDFPRFCPGGLNLDFKPLAREGLLLALEREPAEASVAKREGVDAEGGEQKVTEEKANIPCKCRLHLLHKGLHFWGAEYNKAPCPANI